MKNKTVLFALFCFFAFCFCVQKTFAYGYDTHALLTKEAIGLYDRSAVVKIPDNLQSFLIDGSRQEDNAPRWLNHFYDPIYDRPLRFDPAIDPQLALAVNIMYKAASAKDWAQSEILQGRAPYNITALIDIKPLHIGSILAGSEQAKLGSLQIEADFAWQRALRFYINGDKEKAMFTLGHILHLMEDMSVPDHTRNDAHFEDSPYERYASKYDLASSDKDLEKRLENKNPITLDSLDVYFNSLAEYSNKNFYSKDTIGVQSGYPEPQPDYEIIKSNLTFGIKKIDDKEYNIYLRGVENVWLTSALTPIGASLYLEDSKDGDKVLSDYWSLLSTKSVEYSAGIIDLFFREVEKYKDDPHEIPGDRPLLAMIGESVGDFLSNVGFAIKDAALGMIGERSSETIGEVPLNGNSSVNSDNSGIDTEAGPTEDKKVIPTVSASKKEVKQGQVIHEKGNKFTPDSPAVLYFDLPDGRTVSSNIIAGPDGKFDNRYVMPEESVLGRYFYYAEDVKTGAVSEKIFFDVIKGNEKPAPKTTAKENNEDEPDKNDKDEEDDESEPEIKAAKPQPDPKPVCSYGLSGTSPARPVVINEIAWMGSTSSSSDEWVELKNISGNSLDVSGWEFIGEDGDIAVKLRPGTIIPAGGLFLLERTDDDSVPGIPADLIYSGALSNAGEALKLFDGNCLVVDSISVTEWPAGDASSRRTMERSISGTWQTSYYPGGTPKSENSAGYVEPVIQSFSGGGSSSPALCSKKEGDPTKEVLINEVAWSGDSLSASREWIEFYNPSAEAVSLSGWQLLDKSNDVKIIFGSNKSISAGGYVLVEKNPGGLFEDVLSLSVFTGWINNSDESLYLYDGACALIDKVEDTGTNWKKVGGSNSPDHRTAERDEKGWHTYSGVGVGGVMGTPGAVNSERVEENNNESDGENEENEEVEEEESNEESGETENGENEGDEGDEGDESVSDAMGANIVISEIMPGVAGGNDNEFIELYNPADTEIALDGWSLKIKTESGDQDLINSESDDFSGKTIKPKSFMLIGSQSYSGEKTADVVYSEVFLSGNGDVVFLCDAEGNRVDKVGYSEIEGGASWERKAFSGNTCVSASGEGEFLGNGCGASEGDVLEMRNSPNPQNGGSLPEPREKPVISFSENDLILSYDPETVSVKFSYPEFDEGEKAFIIEEDSNEQFSEKEFRVYEVNKTYTFIFKVSDGDGLLSDDSLRKTIDIPGFADFGFYHGVKTDFDNASHGGPLIEVKYASRPFLPQSLVLSEMSPSGSNYKVMVFYLNQDAPKTEFLEYELPAASEPVMSVYYKGYISPYNSRRSLMIPDADNHPLDGAYFDKSLSEDYLDIGDLNIVLPASGPSGETEFTASDCLSVAYYGFHRGNPSTPETYKLIATDNKKYCFSGEYNSLPPASPSNIRVENHDGIDLILWDVPIDPDSPDRLITYEISTDGENWLPAHANMLLPEGEAVHVRAIDDFGSMSAPVIFTSSIEE